MIKYFFLKYPVKDVSELENNDQVVVLSTLFGRTIFQKYEDYKKEFETGEKQQRFILKGKFYFLVNEKGRGIYEINIDNGHYFLEKSDIAITGNNSNPEEKKLHRQLSMLHIESQKLA